MSKYDKLWLYIRNSNEDVLTLDFAQIKHIAGVAIDHSFLKYKKELTDYGYTVSRISMKEQKVMFKKAETKPILVLYIHGKGGTADECELYKPLFPDCDVIGLDYKAETPWEARAEFADAVRPVFDRYDHVVLIANSIGAYFAMCALPQEQLEKAYFISPIVDMEKLICRMMQWAGVTEQELRERGTIDTDFGETLSWEYLCYVRQNPASWDVPTDILYGEYDNMTTAETVSDFAAAHGAGLTVMKAGEHWFHTEEQLKFLSEWITQCENGR